MTSESAPAPSLEAHPAEETFSVNLIISSLDIFISNLNHDSNTIVHHGQGTNVLNGVEPVCGVIMNGIIAAGNDVK